MYIARLSHLQNLSLLFDINDLVYVHIPLYASNQQMPDLNTNQKQLNLLKVGRAQLTNKTHFYCEN